MITLLVAGILLRALQVILRRSVGILTMNAIVRLRVRKLLPATFSVLWVAYGWLVLYVLFGTDELYPIIAGAILLVIVALIGWYLLRDVVAGVAFMTKHPNLLHHRIHILNTDGKVVRLGPTNLHLRTDDGEIRAIPYSRIAGEPFTDYSETFVSDRFSFSFPVEGTADQDALSTALRADLLLLPWLNSHLSLQVKVSHADHERKAEITFHCLNEDHASIIEQQIRKRFEPSRVPAKKKRTARPKQ